MQNKRLPQGQILKVALKWHRKGIYKNRQIFKIKINNPKGRDNLQCVDLQYYPPFLKLRFRLMSQRNQLSTNNKHYRQKGHEAQVRLLKKQSKYILKQQEDSNTFDFNKHDKDFSKIVQTIIDQKLKDRNTIILAKLARQKFKHSDPQNSQDSHQKINEMQDPLIFKSIDQINKFYCIQISQKIISKLARFLKSHNMSAKIVTTGLIIEDLNCGFSIGGICFWNNSSDGQRTFKIKIPPVTGYKSAQQKASFLEKQKVNPVGKQKINPVVGSERVNALFKQKANLHGQQKEIFCDEQGLLIVTVYICRFQKRFMNK